jgi:membrane protease YdiL (CAAX protease family)
MSIRIGGMMGKTILAAIMFMGLLIALNLLVQIFLPEKGLELFPTPVALGLTAWFMYVLFERRKQWNMGWRDRQAVSQTFMGILIISIVVAVTMSIMLLTGNIALEEHSWSRTVVMGQLMLFLLVAIGEEWLFRGYFFGLYQSLTGRNTAILLNSCLFTATHLFNPESLSRPLEFIIIEMANLFLLSLLMSFARVYSGSLWMPIGIHFFMNFLQSSIFGFLNGGKQLESLFSVLYGNKTLWNGAGYGLESSLVLAVGLSISIFVLMFFYKKSTHLNSQHKQIL